MALAILMLSLATRTDGWIMPSSCRISVSSTLKVNCLITSHFSLGSILLYARPLFFYCNLIKYLNFIWLCTNRWNHMLIYLLYSLPLFLFSFTLYRPPPPHLYTLNKYLRINTDSKVRAIRSTFLASVAQSAVAVVFELALSFLLIFPLFRHQLIFAHPISVCESTQTLK